MPYILAIDQGTTSSRAIVFDADARAVGVVQQEFPQIYPASGLVEHDPEDLWSTAIRAAREVVAKTGIDVADIAAIGITNQRETTLVWDRATGKPIHNAIIWQEFPALIARLTMRSCRRDRPRMEARQTEN